MLCGGAPPQASPHSLRRFCKRWFLTCNVRFHIPTPDGVGRGVDQASHRHGLDRVRLESAVLLSQLVLVWLV